MSNIKVNGIDVEWTTFSDGSENCKVPVGLEDIKWVHCEIEDCTRDLVRLMLVVDALDRLYCWKAPLFMSYFPQARADRVFELGMAAPKLVFSEAIDRLGFSKVCVQDIHSNVDNPLNIVNQPQHSLLQTSWFYNLKRNNNVVLCSPDKGAILKCKEVAEEYNLPMITGYKSRDVTTGQITGCGIEEQESLEGKFVLMVDDIADGGATFKFLAKEIEKLNPAGIGLYVTHGIFAKGLDLFELDLDMIQCHNIVCNYITEEDIMNFNSKFNNKQLCKESN